jgi:hypothetical protein
MMKKWHTFADEEKERILSEAAEEALPLYMPGGPLADFEAADDLLEYDDE